jgi:hypothetical protein
MADRVPGTSYVKARRESDSEWDFAFWGDVMLENGTHVGYVVVVHVVECCHCRQSKGG